MTPSFEIVESNRARHAAEIRECFLVQLAPDLRRRSPTGFMKCVTAVPKRHHEQSRSTVLACKRIAREHAFAVIDLRLLTGLSFKSTTDLRCIGTQLAREPFDGIVGALKSVVLDEVLADRRAIAALGQLALDERTERRRAAARRRRVGGHVTRGGRFWAGGHFARGATFCRRQPGFVPNTAHRRPMGHARARSAALVHFQVPTEDVCLDYGQHVRICKLVGSADERSSSSSSSRLVCDLNRIECRSAVCCANVFLTRR